MARKIAKRGYIRLPGLMAAAKDLRCTYSHLRRVIRGERSSRSLMARYRVLDVQESESAAPKT